jgi:hypothetical protein
MAESHRTRWQTIKQIAKEPECAFALMLLVFLVQDVASRYFLDQVPAGQVLSTLSRALWAFSNNPLVELLMIPLAIWLFARGVKRVEDRQSALAAEQAQAQKQETEIRDAALKQLKTELGDRMSFPVLMAKVYMKQERCKALGTAMGSARAALSGYDHYITKVETGEEAARSTGNMMDSKLDEASRAMWEWRNILSPLPWSPDFQKPRPHIRSGGSLTEERFDRSENTYFLQVHRANLATMRKEDARLDGLHHTELMDLENMRRLLNGEALRLDAEIRG